MIFFSEAAEDVWDPQGMGVGVDTYDPEDDRGISQGRKRRSDFLHFLGEDVPY